jgi:hypothetical protein
LQLHGLSLCLEVDHLLSPEVHLLLFEDGTHPVQSPLVGQRADHLLVISFDLVQFLKPVHQFLEVASALARSAGAKEGGQGHEYF